LGLGFKFFGFFLDLEDHHWIFFRSRRSSAGHCIAQIKSLSEHFWLHLKVEKWILSIWTKWIINIKTSKYQFEMVLFGHFFQRSTKLKFCFINDLAYFLDGLSSKLFADDTTIYLSGPELDPLVLLFKKRIEPLGLWCRQNRLDINWSTTYIMLYNF